MGNSKLTAKFISLSIVSFMFVWVVPQQVNAEIDVEMRLNDGGFVSYDHFKAELYLNNHDAMVPDAQIFGLLEVMGVFYYWSSFSTEVDFQIMDIDPGESYMTFLEFDFPNIDEFIPFGPMYFWGAWFLDMESWGYDVQEFWLDEAHKWTPTPLPATSTPTTPPGSPTNTPVPPTNTPTSPTPTPPPAPTGFVYFDPGSFTMGSPSDEPCRYSDETQHQVTLTRGFYMLQTEVTRQMWADLKAVQPLLPSDPSHTSYSPTMNHPVQRNTWYEAVLFANLMSVQYGYTRCYYKDSGFTTPVDATNYTSGSFSCNFNANGYRLPTESEWEYACRAGTTGAFSCSEPNYNSGNCSSCTSGTHPVLEQYCVYCANDPGGAEVMGSKLPNPAGLYDIHGNVHEWCWDWYDSDYYEISPSTDPTGASSGSDRVVRGGGWSDLALSCRSAVRDYSYPSYRYGALGFRLLRSTN